MGDLLPLTAGVTGQRAVPAAEIPEVCHFLRAPYFLARIPIRGTVKRDMAKTKRTGHVPSVTPENLTSALPSTRV